MGTTISVYHEDDPILIEINNLSGKLYEHYTLKRPIFKSHGIRRYMSEEFLDQEYIKGKRKLGNYLNLGIIGRGMQSEISIGLDLKYGQFVAIKSCLNRKKLESCLNELRITKELSHYNVVETFGHIYDGKYHYSIIEYIEGGVSQKSSFARPLKLTSIQKFTRDVLLGLEYIHSKGIIHCDLKPENIMISRDGRAKIVDFGSASFKDSQVGKGTYAFYSPELISGQKASTSMDVWSLGITVYLWVTGVLPFKSLGRSLSELFRIITNNEFSIHHRFTPELTDFLFKTLDKNSLTRASIDTLLKHDFITKSVVQVEIADSYMDGEEIASDYLTTTPQLDIPVPLYRQTIDRLREIRHSIRQEHIL
jgi:serine/threonine protein kinase